MTKEEKRSRELEKDQVELDTPQQEQIAASTYTPAAPIQREPVSLDRAWTTRKSSSDSTKDQSEKVRIFK